MRTLFAKFLLWFWVGLAALLGLEYVLESRSLEEGLAVHSASANGPLSVYADIARVTLAESGLDGLGRLRARFDAGGAVETFFTDGAGPERGTVPLSPDAVRAGRAALRARAGTLIETPDGLFVAYPLGSAQGRELALVVHPRRGSGTGTRSAGRGEGGWNRWLPFLPADLAERALLMLVFGGVGCYVLARYVSAPVMRLRWATSRIADGDLGARVGRPRHKRRDELVELGRDFDRMAERLQALVGAQRRLLADVSHELRSPLARMNVAMTLLRDRLGHDDEGMIDRLEAESRRLDGLIGDALTLSRSESGEPVPAPERVDLGELVRGIAADARFEAGGSTELRIACDGRVEVMGSPGLLRSALDNVVRNAVRHTRAGTPIEIAVGPGGGDGTRGAEVVVRDHGPGLPGVELERIFEPFYRFEGTAGRPPAGTGLGLAIAKRIVAQHGGSIRAEAAPGEGLRVTIRLPDDPPRPA